MNNNYTIDPKKIIFVDLDPTEAVVLHLDSKHYYRLNETGQFIWKALEKGTPIDRIASDLCQEYDIDLAAATSDVTALLDKLKDESLIMQGSSPAANFSIEKAHQAKKQKAPL